MIGPFATVNEVLNLLAKDPQIDAALLDVNVDGAKVYPVADAHALRGVPHMFSTGYDKKLIDAGFGSVPLQMKPIAPSDAVQNVAQVLSPDII